MTFNRRCNSSSISFYHSKPKCTWQYYHFVSWGILF